MLGAHSFEIATESRSEIGVVTGGISDQISAPVVENAAVGVGEAVGNVSFEFAAAGFKTINGRIYIAHWWPPGRLDLGPMENSIAQVNSAARIQAERIRGVMGIGRVHP